MDAFLAVLISLLPYLIISFTLIYLVHETFRFIKSRDEELALRQKSVETPAAPTSINSAVVNLELQAAERFALYLERISPDRLVMRLHQSGMSAKMLQSEMLKAIREEFDHNLSQQIYVSEGAWELIKIAKEEMVKFVSASGDMMTAKDSGLDLIRKIFEAASRVEKLPSERALEYLRKETRRHMK